MIEKDIYNISELEKCSEDDLLKMYKVGSKSIAEINEKLKNLGKGLKIIEHDYVDEEKIAEIRKNTDEILKSDLSDRVINALCSNGIFKISELENYSKDDLLKFKNLGQLSINEIETKLNSVGKRLKVDKGDSKGKDGVFQLNLQPIIFNALYKKGILKISQLEKCTESDLLEIRFIGPEAIKEIKLKLKSVGKKLKVKKKSKV